MRRPELCPECGSDDVVDAGFTPMEGSVMECCRCRHTFPSDDEGPPDDEWINRAYMAQAGPNPRKN